MVLVDDLQAHRDGRGQPHLGAVVAQPRRVVPGGLVVADALQVDGAHPHPAVQQHLGQCAARLQRTRRRGSRRHERAQLVRACRGERREPVACLLGGAQHLDVGPPAHVLQLGDEPGERHAALLDLLVAPRDVRLLPGEQGREPDLRADRAEPLVARPRLLDEHQAGQLVQRVADLRLVDPERGREQVRPRVAVPEHLEVDRLSGPGQSESLQHGVTPRSDGRQGRRVAVPVSQDRTGRQAREGVAPEFTRSAASYRLTCWFVRPGSMGAWLSTSACGASGPNPVRSSPRPAPACSTARAWR